MRIALVNMPFGFHIYPSIQLGTLATLLKTHGWETDCFYFNLHFAHEIGLDLYGRLCEERHLLGEWLFSGPLFGGAPGNQDYARRYTALLDNAARSADRPPQFLLDIKSRLAPEFLRRILREVDWGRYGAVGFTSTFNQNIAALTLARWIKEKYPQIKILFGGANFESEMGMEYFRAFPWIDFVAPGEAEPVLPGLMDAIARGASAPAGVMRRENGRVVYEAGDHAFADLERYGPPDYDDYFAQLQALDPRSPLRENPVILYETARGCWWGEKHHCTFCGLNASAMQFRAKSPEKVRREIAALAKKYDSFRFRLVDNILDRSYVDAVFGRFARENYDLQFFVEIKSNLTREQIKTLARGGVNVIQPGIESLCASQLLEMDKGVRPWQNILCLKWAMYYGMNVEWNILTGFPGETDGDYRQQIDTLRALYHLHPPLGVGNLWLERFSPYFTRPADYGIEITGPGEAYAHVYDGKQVDLMKIAYDFEYKTPSCVDPALAAELRQTVADWQQRHKSGEAPFLLFTKSMEFVTVYDTRGATAVKTRYEGAAAWIILFCGDGAKTLEQIRAHTQEKGGGEECLRQLDAIVSELASQRILFAENGRYLTLAVPHNAHI